MLHPILRQGIRLFIGTTSKTRNYILLSTRGRRSCYSRPRVMLPSAASSATIGRESMTCHAFQDVLNNDEEMNLQWYGKTNKGGQMIIYRGLTVH